MSSEHVEVLERLRGVLEHGKMGDKCLIAPDLVTAAIEALSAPQPPAEAQPVAWQFQSRDGNWHEFIDERHRQNTIADGSWPVRALYTAPPSAPVGVDIIRDGRAIVDEFLQCASIGRPHGKLIAQAKDWLADAEAALTKQPAAIGEEIMVNAAHDVYTLPLQPSGLSSGPRFVVHVPAPEQQPAAPVLAKHQPCGCVICTCEDEQQCQGCGAKHCGNRADHPPYVGQQPAAVDGDSPYPAPRNRQEAAALAKLALAYLGVTSAHIDAAVARCETDLAAQPGGGK